MVGASIQCPTCRETIRTTHPMQTLQAQYIAHARTHGLTIKEARRQFNKQEEATAKLYRIITAA